MSLKGLRTYIMYTKTYILDAINRLTALLQIFFFFLKNTKKVFKKMSQCFLSIQCCQ